MLFYSLTCSSLLLFKVLIGLFLTAALVAFGGDYIQQYIGFAIVPLTILGVWCILEAKYERHWSTFLLSVLLIINTFIPKTETHLKPYSPWSTLAGEQRKAVALDRLMDACHIDRYFLLADLELYSAFMRHATYQTFYGQRRAKGAVWPDISGDQEPNEWLQEKWLHDLETTQLVVGRSDTFLANSIGFTMTPPPCAKGLTPIEDMTLFFPL